MTYNAMYSYMSSLISQIYFVNNYVRGAARFRGIFRIQPDI